MHRPLHDFEPLTKLHNETGEQIYDIHAAANASERHIRNVMSILESTASRYYQTGVAIIPDHLRLHWEGLRGHSGTPRGFFRELASFWQRPFVCAERYAYCKNSYTSWWAITIPSNKRMDKLAVPFMLAATETKTFSGGGSGYGLDRTLLYRDDTAGSWRFYADEHSTFLRDFERHCYTNPVCRVLLNLAGIPKPE